MTLHVKAKLPDTVLIHLRKILDAHTGDVPVYFSIEDVGGQRLIKSSSRVRFDSDLVRELEEILGRGTVRVGDTNTGNNPL